VPSGRFTAIGNLCEKGLAKRSAICHASPKLVELRPVSIEPALRPKNLSERSKVMDGPFGSVYCAQVYAIRGPERIKFGRTMNVARRFPQIQCMSPVPVELLGSVWMPDDAEAYIHDYLKEDRSHGEWFYVTEKSRGLAAFIAAGDVVNLAREIGLGWRLPEYKVSLNNR
jgi:hypothetical protein